MGSSRNVRFSVHMRLSGRAALVTPAEWVVRKRANGTPGHGAPTDAKLEGWIAKHNESLAPGECNDHLDAAEHTILAAAVVDNRSGEIVARAGEFPA